MNRGISTVFGVGFVRHMSECTHVVLAFGGGFRFMGHIGCLAFDR